jgi:hypothetical protein
MDSQLVAPLEPFGGGLDFVDQRQHIAGIARIAYGEMGGKDKACGGLRDDPRLAPKLGRTVAFALEDGGNSAIVGIDDFAVAQPLALSQPTRLFADIVMGLQRGLQVASQAFALALGEMGRAQEALLCGLGQRGKGAAKFQKLLFSLTHQADEDVPLAPALAAKAAHDLLEVVVQHVGVALQCGRLRGALRRDGLDELEDFFCAL